MVGAVLVHEGRIIGEGWHKRYGQAHAEVNCLENVAAADKHLVPLSTMYVNLEPCAHHGKTPPCAIRLVSEKVKEAIISNADPYEEVAGRGVDILRSNDIAVTLNVLREEGLWLNRRFFCFHQQMRPYIILKWAQTPEGHFAPADKSRFPITNAQSQALVHKWRTEEAAILVGFHTALNDNPQLTARLWEGRQPLRIVLDRKLQVSHTHNLYKPDARTWIVNEHKGGDEEHVSFIRLRFDDTLIPSLLQRLHESNILSLIVEGGEKLLNSFVAQNLWDEARILTGQATLPHGSIPAPVLNNATSAFTADIATDRLNVFVNNKSAYRYMPGMEL